MGYMILATLLALCGEQIQPISEAVNYELNEVPATITIIYKDQRVAFPIIPNVTSNMSDSHDILLADPILCDDGNGWEPLVGKTSQPCKVYDFVNLCCKDKDFDGGCK